MEANSYPKKLAFDDPSFNYDSMVKLVDEKKRKHFSYMENDNVNNSHEAPQKDVLSLRDQSMS